MDPLLKIFFGPPKKIKFAHQKIYIFIYKNIEPKEFFLDPNRKKYLDRQKKNYIGATIRIGREIQCLQYAMHFTKFLSPGFKKGVHLDITIII